MGIKRPFNGDDKNSNPNKRPRQNRQSRPLNLNLNILFTIYTFGLFIQLQRRLQLDQLPSQAINSKTYQPSFSSTINFTTPNEVDDENLEGLDVDVDDLEPIPSVEIDQIIADTAINTLVTGNDEILSPEERRSVDRDYWTEESERLFLGRSSQTVTPTSASTSTSTSNSSEDDESLEEEDESLEDLDVDADDLEAIPMEELNTLNSNANVNANDDEGEDAPEFDPFTTWFAD